MARIIKDLISNMMRKAIFFTLLFLCSTMLLSQVSIGNTNPEAALDVDSADSGLLIPRVALTSAYDIVTVTNPNGGALVESTLVYNLGTGGFTPAGFYYWDGVEWILLDSDSNQVYHGKEIISAAGTLTITGIPFQPNSISITAYANVDSYNLNADNGVGNNNNGIPNVFGFMKGYAQNNSGVIDQQVIYGGGSGNSINDISRYASNTHCVGLRYANQNGTSLGTTTAVLTSFTADGFVLNVDSFADAVVIMYEAYRQ